ncbi:MAG: acetyl-CoA carboxylase biotin carboxyl carrier protein [Rhodospirillales bacterium]|nr:acetyl-CoA carboxylase biotin carboxyl carrier protein [Rhodospirillales bacterium]MCB9964676.1 acetyl-CoA carboxylase biotin carboxyl carrier protein [Rhodospirillales bacterium]MCB9979966.1 acetyl-CoA carboxylase biotin carboxyl carrier protein [Rhodospirillales bacterium]
MKINAKAIRELADLLDETGLTEIEVADGDQSIRVNKGGMMVAGNSGMHLSMSSDPAIPQVANSSAPVTTAGDDHPGAVTSPMVGTAYMAGEPGAAAFVSKGKTVSEGDTLLIIEAMKVMNPIKAPRSGTVTHIAVENGQPVEFGDVLMVIE